MTDLVIVFRTPSPIEAEVVRGLLEAHGITTLVQSDMPRTPFPMALHELRLVGRGRRRPTARERLIESHREERTGARVIPFGAEFEPLERTIGYRFQDRGLLEHALTHRSRVHEDASGGVFDNESMEFLGDSVLGFVIADMLFREFPQHNEGQKSKLKASIVSADVAGAARRAHRPRRVPDPRARRGEDRRPPQARAHRRQLRGADRGDLSRRRDRAGARVHRAAVRGADRGSAAHRRGGGVHRGLQVGAAGVAAVARPRAARRTGWPRKSVRRTGGGSRSRCWSRGEPMARAEGIEQEGSGAGAPRRRALDRSSSQSR